MSVPVSPLNADVTRKFVAVKERRADGQVVFEFAIGWPDLRVELVLPAAAFEAFCEKNNVLTMALAGEPTAGIRLPAQETPDDD